MSSVENPMIVETRPESTQPSSSPTISSRTTVHKENSPIIISSDINHVSEYSLSHHNDSFVSYIHRPTSKLSFTMPDGMLDNRPSTNRLSIESMQNSPLIRRPMSYSDYICHFYEKFPVLIFFAMTSYVCVYVLIPSSDYFIYSFIKQQMWSQVTLVSYIEIADTCLPDATDGTYILSYVIGSLISPLFYGVAYILNSRDSNVPNFAVIGSIAIVDFLYFIDCFRKVYLQSGLISFSMSQMFTSAENVLLSFYDTALISAAPRSKNWDKLESRLSIQSNTIKHYPVISYLLPRFLFHRNGLGLATALVIGNRWWQKFLLTVFFILYNVNYLFLIYFTNYFRHHSDTSHSLFSKFISFGAYVAINNVFRLFLKRTGLSLDQGKRGSPSMFFICEAIGLFFYFTFYRILFESLVWSEFIIFQSFHLLSEWVLYPLRSSQLFLKILGTLDSYFPGLLSLVFLPQGTDQVDWLHFVALDFGLRIVVIAVTSVSILFLFVVVNYVPYVKSALDEGREVFYTSSQIIAVALVSELINAYFLCVVYFRPQRIYVLDKIRNCFLDHRFTFIVVIVSCVLVINPMEAYLEDTPFE